MQRAAASGRAIEAAEFELRFTDGDRRHPLGNAFPLFDPSEVVKGAEGAFLDITERKRAEDQVRLLMREVNHRSKNMLTLVQAVARQTAASEPKTSSTASPSACRRLPQARTFAVKSAWRGVDLSELVQLSQLAHFKDAGDRKTALSFKARALRLPHRRRKPSRMALHELATNAGKYGALSNAGRVKIAWDLELTNGQEAAFVMSWREEDGPPVTPPSRRGFGSTVIVEMAEMGLDAEVVLDYAATGLRWQLKCPAAEVLEEILPPSRPSGGPDGDTHGYGALHTCGGG